MRETTNKEGDQDRLKSLDPEEKVDFLIKRARKHGASSSKVFQAVVGHLALKHEGLPDLLSKTWITEIAFVRDCSKQTAEKQFDLFCDYGWLETQPPDYLRYNITELGKEVLYSA